MTDPIGDAETHPPAKLPLLLETERVNGDVTCKMPELDGAELDPDELSELLGVSPGGVISKQERDFALAAMLIRGRLVTERSLRNALKRWTPFGRLTLRE